MSTALTRIIGIGNPLMADDGIGIKIIHELQKQELPKNVELIDGGCGGFKLLPLFTDCQQLIIVDAADFAAKPGSIKILTNKDLHQIPSPQPNRSGHFFSLPELLEAAQKLNQLPPLTLYLVQISACSPDTKLTAEIETALPALVETIRNILKTP